LFALLLAIYRKRNPGVDIRLVEMVVTAWRKFCAPAILILLHQISPLQGIRMAERKTRTFDGAAPSTTICCTEEVYRTGRPRSDGVHHVRLQFRDKALGSRRIAHELALTDGRYPALAHAEYLPFARFHHAPPLTSRGWANGRPSNNKVVEHHGMHADRITVAPLRVLRELVICQSYIIDIF
jgi:hypothetical protein